MTWTATKRSGVTPVDLYDLAKQHKMVPTDVQMAALSFKSLADFVAWYDIKNAAGEQVADCLVAVFGDQARLDLIPVPRFFASHMKYEKDLRVAMVPVIEELFTGEHAVRRVESKVPVSRSRTKKALIKLGFVHEGRPREAVHFFGHDPEDVHILGLLPRDAWEM